MILLIDHEATSTDPQTARILEIGAVLCDNNLEPIKEFSTLVWERRYPELTPEVSKVTNITLEQLEKAALEPQAAWQKFDEAFMNEDIAWVIAYNKKYDEVLYKAEVERSLARGFRTVNQVYEAPWLCAMEDIESNYSIKCWRQSHLALEYGIAVDPKKLHRALGDVHLMRQILKAANVTADDMYAFQNEPWTYLVAEVPAPWTDGGKGVAKAKAHGFSWEKVSSDPSGTVFAKSWVKRVKKRWVQKLQDTVLDLKFKEAL
jgi:DNA polymerase III epsilon subunit-like protein